MTFSPQSHARWDGVTPLRSGLAVNRASKGTLGLAVRFLNNKTYFTCARHVAGKAGSLNVAMKVHGPTDFVSEPTLIRLSGLEELGPASLLKGLDLTTLETPDGAVNVTPDGKPPLDSLGVTIAGDQLTLRGCLHSSWVTTTYESHYNPALHDQFFTGQPFLTAHLGIIDLVPLGSADQAGNSGSVVWLFTPDGYAAVGHLVAVSTTAPKGLIVRYRSAFESLGFPIAGVVRT